MPGSGPTQFEVPAAVPPTLQAQHASGYPGWAAPGNDLHAPGAKELAEDARTLSLAHPSLHLAPMIEARIAE